MGKVIRGIVFFLLFAVSAAWVIEQYRPRTGPSLFDQAYTALSAGMASISGGSIADAGAARQSANAQPGNAQPANAEGGNGRSGSPDAQGPASAGSGAGATRAGATRAGTNGGRPNSGGPAGQQRGRPPAAVEVVAATLKQVQQNIEAVGSTRANRSVEVVSLAAGRVETVHFEAGDRVTAGSLLVSLEDRMESADLRNSKATLEEAERALTRTEQLAERGNVSEAGLEQARANLIRAEANHDQDQLALDHMTIEAPFDGIMGFRQVEPGARIDPSTVIGRIDDLSRVELQVSLPENFFSQVKIGLPATATAAAFPGRLFDGVLSLIDQRIDEASRSFQVRVAIPNDDYELPAGMFMVVDLTLQAREGVVVPEEAVVSDAGVSYVYVLKEGIIDKREVKIGIRQSAEAEVLTGLTAGELVVTRGVQKVRDGSPARAIEVASDGERVARRPTATSIGPSSTGPTSVGTGGGEAPAPGQ